MLACDYYTLLNYYFPKEVHKSQFIYIYTTNGIVKHVLFRYRKKNKYCLKKDVPHEKLLLSRDKVLPKDVVVQICFAPLKFNLLEW